MIFRDKNSHEVVIPHKLEKRFKGVSIGYDVRVNSGGYFVFTHRFRSKCYSTIKKIPLKVIAEIEETG